MVVQAEVARLLDLWARLKVEAAGVRVRNGESAYRIVKREFLMVGSRQEVYASFTRILQQCDVLKERRPRKPRAAKRIVAGCFEKATVENAPLDRFGDAATEMASALDNK